MSSPYTKPKPTALLIDFDEPQQNAEINITAEFTFERLKNNNWIIIKQDDRQDFIVQKHINYKTTNYSTNKIDVQNILYAYPAKQKNFFADEFDSGYIKLKIWQTFLDSNVKIVVRHLRTDKQDILDAIIDKENKTCAWKMPPLKNANSESEKEFYEIKIITSDQKEVLKYNFSTSQHRTFVKKMV